MSQKEIVTYLINTDETLYKTYNLYQGILKTLNNKDFESFKKIIHNAKTKYLIKKTKQAIKTFINMEKYIQNAFTYEYSNGITEGMNNLIKGIIHSACGYRKFNHLKIRILLIKGIVKINA